MAKKSKKTDSKWMSKLSASGTVKKGALTKQAKAADDTVSEFKAKVKRKPSKFTTKTKRRVNLADQYAKADKKKSTTTKKKRSKKKG